MHTIDRAFAVADRTILAEIGEAILTDQGVDHIEGKGEIVESNQLLFASASFDRHDFLVKHIDVADNHHVQFRRGIGAF